MSIDVTQEGDRIVDAKARSTMFRGFEWMMRGRNVTDAVYMTQRVCGICSLAHGAVGSYLLDELYNNHIPENAQFIRNIMYAADFLQNHIRHFYIFELPDYVKMPNRPPWLGQDLADARLNPEDNQRMVEHYYKAVKAAQESHQLLTLFGGKAPHQHSFVHGGVTVAPTVDKVNQATALIDNIHQFVSECMVPDTYLIARVYRDYYHIGVTPRRLISFGLFRFGPENEEYLWPAGVLFNNCLEELDVQLIKESITNSYFENSKKNVTNSGDNIYDNDLKPAPYKEDAYSWIKTIKYAGQFFETGPLARAIIRGDYNEFSGQPSTMDRIMARSLETLQLTNLVKQWLEKITPGPPPLKQEEEPVKDRVIATTDAMRGALLHSTIVDGEKITRYNIITPTVWNFSPADKLGNHGPVENALIGIRTRNQHHLYTVMGRIIRSFDPCISCGTHVMDINGDIRGEIIY